MSGPYDRAEDPDEVTLWAGRLRAWPTPPSAEEDEVEDETILSRPEAPEDDTVRSGSSSVADETEVSHRAVSDDDTIRPRGDVPDDETVVSRRAVPEDDTIRAHVDAPADETVVSRRTVPDDATIRPRGDVPDDETVISRGGAPEDATAVSRRAPEIAPSAIEDLDEEVGATAPRSVISPRADAVPAPPALPRDETPRRGPDAVPGDVVDEEEITRRRAAVDPVVDEATRARPVAEVDGDTASASRRRRREVAAAASGPLVEGAVRDARVPEALARESYGARREGPARVERVPVVRTPSSEDAAAVRPRARRGAARVVVLVTVIVVVVIASAIGAVLLLTG